MRTPKKSNLRFRRNLVNQGLTQAHKNSLSGRQRPGDSLKLKINDIKHSQNNDSTYKPWDLQSTKQQKVDSILIQEEDDPENYNTGIRIMGAQHQTLDSQSTGTDINQNLSVRNKASKHTIQGIAKKKLSVEAYGHRQGQHSQTSLMLPSIHRRFNPKKNPYQNSVMTPSMQVKSKNFKSPVRYDVAGSGYGIGGHFQRSINDSQSSYNQPQY